MEFEAWLTIGTILTIFVLLALNLVAADLAFIAGAALLAACGVITTNEAFSGFSNPGVLTVAVLFIVAAALRETGVLNHVGHLVLGKARTSCSALKRLIVVVIPMSAFLNNTPIVAIFVPMVLDWCRHHRIAPSKLLMPLSFLAILGGTCTMVGTSTNLVVNGLLLENNMRELQLFEIGKIGLPYAIIGSIYLCTIGNWLLPERKEFIEQLTKSRREYLAEMEVQPGCRLIGKTIEQAGLRQLSGLFLIEINRGETIIGPVSPDTIIRENDRLVFTGVLSSIIDLERIPGFVPTADPSYEVSPQGQRGRQLCEAVVSSSSPLVGKTIRDADFRAVYGAAVVAVNRGGERIKQKIGDIRLMPGDTLLLQVGAHFMRAHRNDPAFYLISSVDGWRPLRRDRAWFALALLFCLIVAMSAQLLPTVVIATLVAALMVGFGCISAGDARRSIEYQVIVVIAAAFGIGIAFENSGAAAAVAQLLFNATAGWGPLTGLAAIYIIGVILTSLITNNATAILLFPLCLQTAKLFDVSPMPFIIALILAASACFITPIGYQTNMMVYGPGGYKFTDYARVGGPLNLLLLIVAVVLIPLIWPFR